MLYATRMAEPAEKPRRRWFQFHLSTALALMIVASLLVWANVVERSQYFPEYSLRGWPFHVLWWHSRFGGHYIDFYIRLEWPRLVGDVAINFAILAAVATISELIIRRKKLG